MEILIMVAQLLLGITLLVGIHEFGHFAAARLFGMRVDKFYIGFPPKVFSFRKGETEYGLGALPLGGFVKIAGMVDESLDTANLSAEPQPWEFRSKPAWQRLIVMLGGIILNVVAGILIFTGLVYTQGEKFISASDAKYGVVAGPVAESMGFMTGDKIVAINGQHFDRFNDIYDPDVLLGGEGRSFTIERQGQTLTLPVPANLVDRLSAAGPEAMFLAPIEPFEVEQVMSGNGAAKAGVLPGDKITSVAGAPVRFFHELQAELLKHKDQTIALGIERNGQALSLNAEVNADGKLGIMPKLLLPRQTVQVSLLSALPQGAKMSFEIIYLNIAGLGKIFKGEVSASNSVQGPVAMAKNMYGGIWDWGNFWRITGMISMALAFFNLLPIPALDGGHVVFLLWEMVTRTKPSEKVLEYSQRVGMAMLLLLMVFVFFNDIIKQIF